MTDGESIIEYMLRSYHEDSFDVLRCWKLTLSGPKTDIENGPVIFAKFVVMTSTYFIEPDNSTSKLNSVLFPFLTLYSFKLHSFVLVGK